MKCAYCGKDRKMTREHVIPNGFITRMKRDDQTIWSDRAPKKVIQSEIVVKDVCEECNNGALSSLDAYGLEVILSVNKKIRDRRKKLNFKYNYNKLTRWLLKLCYNAARGHNSEHDISLYQKNIAYILGLSCEPLVATSVFAIYLDTPGLPNLHHLREDSVYEIDWFRITNARIKEKYLFESAVRSVIINSMAFIVAVHNESLSASEIEKIEREMLKNSEMVKLDNLQKVTLRKDKNFLIHSLVTAFGAYDDFLLEYNPILDKNQTPVLLISRSEVEKNDFSQIRSIKTLFCSRQKIKEYYQQVTIWFEGYDDEPRNVYQIQEVQSYVRKIVELFPEIVWFLDVRADFSFRAIVCSYINDHVIHNPNDATTDVEINRFLLADFLNKGFRGVNRLLNNYGFDQSMNDTFTNLFKEAVQNVVLGH